MKKSILFSCLLAILVSCLPKSSNTVSEMELLNDIFLELVGTHHYYEELPFPPLPLEYAKNKQDSINYQIEKEKYEEAYYNPKMDKKELVLGIEPYHLNPKEEFSGWHTQESSFPRMYYEDSLGSKDFDKLLRQLVDSTIFKKKKLKLSKLTKKGRFIIKDLGQLEKQNKDYWHSSEFRYIGSIRFSDFKINKKNDKAIFNFNFLCGSLCGSGAIIFCVKVDGKWKIADRIPLWVS